VERAEDSTDKREPTREEMAQWGFADQLAREIERAGQEDIARPVDLPPALVTEALQCLPLPERSRAAENIEAAKQAMVTELGDDGPLHFAEHKINDLVRFARDSPALQPVVAVLQRHAVRNELARLRWNTARRLLYRPPPAPPSHDLKTNEGAERYWKYRNQLNSNPAVRARHNQLARLKEFLLWCEKAVTALDAGEDAAYAVAQAYRSHVDLLGEANDGLHHVHVEEPRQRGRQGGREAAARIRKEYLDPRDALYRAAAEQLRKKRPGLSDRAIADTLHRRGVKGVAPPLPSFETIRGIIASKPRRRRFRVT